MIAHEDQALVCVAEVRVAPRAVHGNSPLEDCPRNVQASRNDAVKDTSVLRADVDDDGVLLGCRERLGRRKARDLLNRLVNQSGKATVSLLLRRRLEGLVSPCWLSLGCGKVLQVKH